jgi:signal transduction histidine kinase
MKISTRIFLAYVGLSVLLGAATLAAGYYSLEGLVDGIVKEDARLLARELGWFMLPRRATSFASIGAADRRALQDQIQTYSLRSDRVIELQIIGEDGTILFASDKRRLGGRIVGKDELALLASDEVSVRTVHDRTGPLYEITAPIENALGERLGTLRARIVPRHFTTYLDQPRTRFLWFFIILVVLITASGVLVASVFAVPVRRLNRALIELQTKHFQGVPRYAEGDVAGALRTVSQMGESIEALARGARRQEVALSSLSRALDEGVAIFDVTGRVVMANPAAASILQAGEGDDPVVTVAGILEANEGVRALVRETLDGKETKGRDVEVAITGGRKVGVRISAYALRDPDRPAGALLLLRDLASIRTFEQDLQEASRLSVLARLTASVAHEIKNPLNSMVINMEVLRGILGALPEEVRAESDRYVKVVTDEIYRLDEVIRDFLGLTNPSDTTSSPTDVNLLVRKVAELIRYEAHTARTRIVLELDNGVPTVPAVPVRLTQAFLNLALNAIQAMTDGGTLTISSRLVEGRVEIRFEDTGPGIPREIQDKIFNFHFTTRAAGSGLGLSITRLILEAQGGSIRFESDPGRGSIFTVAMPVRAGVDAALFREGRRSGL